jgi:hypothetical protein
MMVLARKEMLPFRQMGGCGAPDRKITRYNAIDLTLQAEDLARALERANQRFFSQMGPIHIIYNGRAAVWLENYGEGAWLKARENSER